jgi:hypothetical protein
MKENDPVNHPKHYTSHPSSIECITITRHMGFNLGNAFKYIWRADLKDNAIQDLEKALFYINDELELRKKKKPEQPTQKPLESTDQVRTKDLPRTAPFCAKCLESVDDKVYMRAGFDSDTDRVYPGYSIWRCPDCNSTTPRKQDKETPKA